MMSHESWNALLATQCGIAARDQLMTAGLSRRGLESAVASGALAPRGPRVFVNPHWSSGGELRNEWKRQLFGALCACSPRQRASAVVFRRSAAVLWRLDGLNVVAGTAGMEPVEIAVFRGRPSPGARCLTRALAPGELDEVEGLPVTSVARTLMDLGQVVSASVLERALESALRKDYVTMARLRGALDAAPRLRGTSCLRSLLASRPAGLPPTESDAETLFVQLARGIGLPAPQRQYVVQTPEGRFRVDFAWPALRVAIEIDGAQTHASASALDRDLRRQNRIVLALGSAGWILLRFSWLSLVSEPYKSQTCAQLRQAWSIGSSHPLAVMGGVNQA
jgi:very-short-patch-repair endonuclease